MGTAFHYGIESLAQTARQLNKLGRIAVIGSGTMGIGIAIDVLNKTNYKVVLVDISADALKKAASEIESYFSAQLDSGRLLPEQKQAYCDRVIYTSDYLELKDAEIIWEVATEDLKIKSSIFKLIETHANLEKLLVVFSNTSSHTTAELAELFQNDSMRRRFLTGHGYFPFHVNRLFDVMKGKYASEETFQTAVMFGEQILEKKVIALRTDHHGYVTDPIFQALAAIVSWDITSAKDLMELPQIFTTLTANPFEVLDRTGHMPYTKSAQHFKAALPKEDRLAILYKIDERPYPQWIEDLERSGKIGLAGEKRSGFYEWQGPAGKEKAARVYDPGSKEYVSYAAAEKNEYLSLKEAEELDRRKGSIKSIEGLLHIAGSSDQGGRTFRRYVVPIVLYALDLIQDGFSTAAEINTSTRVGLRFKHGLAEIIDGFIRHFGIDGFIDFIKRAQSENADRSELFDLDGKSVARKDRPSLLRTMKEKGWSTLLGYGRVYGVPVSCRNFSNGELEPAYNDLRFVPPTGKDRVATIIFDNPLRGNVWNKDTLDQFDHAIGIAVKLFEKGELGALLFTACGVNMRMLGADARQFNRGWFDPAQGYQFLGKEEAGRFTKDGMAIFRFLQEVPIWTIGVFGEKWGGGAEFTYFLNQRFDLVADGVEYDTLSRKAVLCEKKNYNQPEIDYAILAGFGGVQELRRLGMGDSLIDEIFLQGLTATRAYQVGLSNGLGSDEYSLLERAYELARVKQKFAAPYSVDLFQQQKKNAFLEGINDKRLVEETAETFDPAINPYIEKGILRLLNRGAKNPPMDLSCRSPMRSWSQIYSTLFEQEDSETKTERLCSKASRS